MKEFHFTKTYFNKLVFEDATSAIRVFVKEMPSLDVSEEDYSLRVETHHTEVASVHRAYAIEHHSRQEKHTYPHLQFKFHTEDIGTFWLRLDFDDQEEYKSAILGFIYKIKDVLHSLETLKPGICGEILVLELVNGLSAHGAFLDSKIAQSVKKRQVEFEGGRGAPAGLDGNPLLVAFLGPDTVTRIVRSVRR